jgi:hypothetical protein
MYLAASKDKASGLEWAWAWVRVLVWGMALGLD